MIKDHHYYNLLLCNTLSEEVDNSKLEEIEQESIVCFLDDESVVNFLNQRFKGLPDFENQLKCIIHDFRVTMKGIVAALVVNWASGHLEEIKAKFDVWFAFSDSCDDLLDSYYDRIYDNISVYDVLLGQANFESQSFEDQLADVGMSIRDFL